MSSILPDGKRFAFTVFDDTDVATLDSIRPVYDLLHELGMRTTKTVWPLGYDGRSAYAGSSSLEDPEYREYMKLLQARGFEIAFHGARMETTQRADTARALALFRETFGTGPTSYAAHSHNRDNLYWGRNRFRFRIWRLAYSLLAGGREPSYAGHIPGSDVYWADLAPELRYVRNLTFDGLDLNRVAPAIAYQTKGTPGVRAWFSSCDADNVEEFVHLLRPENQQALEQNAGICILSTHFGKGFVHEGRVREDVRDSLLSLSRRNGWFVPVTELLDYLVAQRGLPRLEGWPLFALEGKWFLRVHQRRKQQRRYAATETAYLLAAQAARKLKAKAN